MRIVTPAGPPPTAATATPQFDIAAGTYLNPQTVNVTDATPGAAVNITFDGVIPVTGPTGYRGPIQVTGSVTINAIAAAPGFLPSPPASAAYTIATPPASLIATIAGSGVSGFSGAGGPATSAELGDPKGIALDSGGDVFIADSYNNVVWEAVAATGNIAIVAGTGTADYSGDNGPATAAQLNGPFGVATDAGGNLYIADTNNNVVRMVAANTGLITTVAGNGQQGTIPPYGDGGPAASANLSWPEDVAFDSSGNLYIADTSHGRVREVIASSGLISTVAGGGTSGQLGDGGQATSATLYRPVSIALDSASNLYIADQAAGRV
ncbi:MAG TPA: chitobiase/beta-hexosaminidase C-terminal domain-containing protein, partial [Sphingomicrobium sp.]|nr:chitobiase/beta-hexosaminidase C-terminal domain-containing protein [Sphingomicrobium sp.]